MNTNFLILVADSCRYDTFMMAKTPNLDLYFDMMEAGACATFTYPAHAAMFQGFFPVVNHKVPIYNRFVKALFRWFYTTKRDCVFELDNQSTIPFALRTFGYDTVLYGGVGWFRMQSPLSEGFRIYQYEPDAAKAIQLFIDGVNIEPFFGVINFGTTHRPYICPGMPQAHVRYHSPRSGNVYDSAQLNSVLRKKQVQCLEYIDNELGSLFRWLKQGIGNTVVCFCADHGDCMGENGCYGHGFSHPSVMRVPLAWSLFNAQGAFPLIDDKAIDFIKQ